MANLSVTLSLRAANDLTLAEASNGGDYFVNTGREMILARNVGFDLELGPTSITVVTPDNVDGLVVGNRTVNIGYNKYALLGPFGPEYEDAQGRIQLSYADYRKIRIVIIRKGAL